MRDPVGPIPSPSANNRWAKRYWEHAAPPPPQPAAKGAFDPMRLLSAAEADAAVIDRRQGPRAHHAMANERPRLRPHENLDAILGLTTRSGWALVHAFSASPSGILVRVLDTICTPAALRGKVRAAVHQLADPAGTSPLTTVGRFVLAPRVVADLKALTQPASSPDGSHQSCRVRSRVTHVTLVVPGPHRRAANLQIRGEVVRLSDPTPGVLAIALSPAAGADLERALRPLTPGQGPGTRT